MQCTVKWAGLATEHNTSGMRFDAHTGSGHVTSMDGAPEGGGNNLAPRPMELVLAGTGGCTAYDVVLILKRGRQNVTGCDVQLTAKRAEVDPKVFTEIHMQFTITGKSLNHATVERAVALSHEKYCSASIMLAHSVVITHGVTVVEG
jgi:putative redox protein